MPLCCVILKNVSLGDFPGSCFSISYLEVGIGVAIPLGFDSFSILTIN